MLAYVLSAAFVAVTRQTAALVALSYVEAAALAAITEQRVACDAGISTLRIGEVLDMTPAANRPKRQEVRGGAATRLAS